LIEVNQVLNFSPVNLGPGSMELGTMFGMILVEFIIVSNVITHWLTHTGGLHYPGHHHSLMASNVEWLIFHYWGAAAAAVAEEVGRVSVESGVDS
jgi:hypothetical protein